MRYELDTTGEYWIYLRKSREDIQAEARGEGETLAKHRKALFKLSKELRINITEVFDEIASGESMFHRPEMLKMMELMETRKPKGILVMDVDRLGRGNMQEQGLILDTFRRLNILIITPRKVYDLNNEFDEEYSEFEAFMARKELKIITRRLQGGRKRSAEDGNYIGTRPPYGYLIHKTDRERFLVPHPEQAPVVRMIFEWYSDPKKRMGSSKIAYKLNELRLPSYDGKAWEPSAILNILKNEVYLGRIQWGKKEQKKSKEPGKKRETRKREEGQYIDVSGKHEPLIDEQTFQRAKEIRSNRDIVPFDVSKRTITNPLAGIVKCGKCGHSMVMRPYGKQLPHMICSNQNRLECDNKSSRFVYIEEAVIGGLEKYLEDYRMKWGTYRKEKKQDGSDFIRASIESLKKELKETEDQQENIYDLFERKIYTEEMFLERSRKVTEKMSEIKSAITKAESDLKQEEKKQKANKDIIPTLQKVIRIYRKTDDPAKKNALLKSVLKSVIYIKEKHQRNDEFKIDLVPRLK